MAVSFTSKATGVWNVAGQLTWDQANFPVDGDDVTIEDPDVVTQERDEACAGLVIDEDGELDMVTFNLVNSAATVINGILSMGVSGDTGLETVRLTIGATARMELDSYSIIRNSGDVSVTYDSVWFPTRKGAYVQTGNGDGLWPNSVNTPRSFTVNEGVKLKLVGLFDIGNGVYGVDSGQFINGVIDCVDEKLLLRCGSSGTLEFGENSDIEGSAASELIFIRRSSSTFINHKTTEFVFAGEAECQGTGSNECMLITGDWRNALYRFRPSDSEIGSTGAFELGILTTNDFEVRQNYDYDVHVYCNSNNPSFRFYGNVHVYQGIGSFITIWHKGTGGMAFKKTGAQTADFQNNEIEAVTIDSGSHVTWSNDLRSDGLAVNGELTLDATKTHVVKNPSGNGTIHGSGGIAVIYYTGTNTFSGVMDNAQWEEIDSPAPKPVSDLSIDKVLTMEV